MGQEGEAGSVQQPCPLPYAPRALQFACSLCRAGHNSLQPECQQVQKSCAFRPPACLRMRQFPLPMSAMPPRRLLSCMPRPCL